MTAEATLNEGELSGSGAAIQPVVVGAGSEMESHEVHPGVVVDAPPPTLAEPIQYQDMASLGLDPESKVQIHPG